MGNLLDDVDAHGRDFWFYVLTSPSTELLNALKRLDAHAECYAVCALLLQQHPPRLDVAGHGWFDWLLLQSQENIDKTLIGGARILSTLRASTTWDSLSSALSLESATTQKSGFIAF